MVTVEDKLGQGLKAGLGLRGINVQECKQKGHWKDECPEREKRKKAAARDLTPAQGLQPLAVVLKLDANLVSLAGVEEYKD